jgi:hypothetical protein
MKKLAAGLAGIVIGAIGCATVTTYPYNDVVGKLRYHYGEIKQLAEAKPEESCTFVDAANKGDPVSVIIDGKEGRRIIIFNDMDKDGNYETRNTLTIPNKLEMQVIPPAPKNPDTEKKKKSVPLDNKKMVRDYGFSLASNRDYTFI